ncbi:MAG: MCE family protein, partial [Mycobacteriaceae bacterium]|nr:MCE family protein [Mycobacteriaceae bacterium]
MLTRFTKIQLLIFSLLTIAALLVISLYYLRLPTVLGVGQYTLTAELPASGGLYRTAVVAYRGTTIGRVTDVQPTENGVRATMSIGNRFKIPVDATANVHSVTAIGEQYIDLVSEGQPDQYFKNGQTITKGTVPTPIGPALDAANRGLAAIPADKIPTLLTETALAVGDLGPSLQRLVDGTQAIVGDLKTNIQDINDIVQKTGPILNSQVVSGDAIAQWAANLNSISSQVVSEDAALRSGLRQFAPAAEQLNAVFSDVQDALPQTLANLAIL